jgi:hypothetical protein
METRNLSLEDEEKWKNQPILNPDQDQGNVKKWDEKAYFSLAGHVN